MFSYKVVIRRGANGPHDGSARPLTKLELLKAGLAAVLGLGVAIAFLLAASVIGLLLAVPLVVLGLAWIVYLALRGRLRLMRRQPGAMSPRDGPYHQG